MTDDEARKWLEHVCDPAFCGLTEKTEQAVRLLLNDHARLKARVAELEAAKPDDHRLWVQEHKEPHTWHYYPNGHCQPALCGHPPIPGTPYVATRPGSIVCTRCANG